MELSKHDLFHNTQLLSLPSLPERSPRVMHLGMSVSCLSTFNRFEPKQTVSWLTKGLSKLKQLKFNKVETIKIPPKTATIYPMDLIFLHKKYYAQGSVLVWGYPGRDPDVSELENFHFKESSPLRDMTKYGIKRALWWTLTEHMHYDVTYTS